MSKKRAKRSFTEAFKQEAVRLALESGKPKSQLSRELGIGDSLLYSWISRYDEAKARGLSVEAHQLEKDRLKQLEKENRRLKDEVELLKKASAYFAKHPQ